ncbi:VanW family protein, partial [Candidatus Peregrinibacteria bacterium]|nr:VanW family protein [Candidatus Peregrinibacteria bacterium]
LKPVPGAGLCQVSTTVYRAILNAGLPIVERRSHSLYVKYYKEYGEGLDATIFQGGQDLIFKNDTPSYLLIQAYDDGDDGYVKIYGTPDGRRASLEGPYRTADIPQEKTEKYGVRPRKNQIFWYRTVTKADGSSREEQIISTYKSLPK